MKPRFILECRTVLLLFSEEVFKVNKLNTPLLDFWLHNLGLVICLSKLLTKCNPPNRNRWTWADKSCLTKIYFTLIKPFRSYELFFPLNNWRSLLQSRNQSWHYIFWRSFLDMCFSMQSSCFLCSSFKTCCLPK